MAKYKAKESYKSAKNKHFGIHKIAILKNGGSIEISDFSSLPESVKGHLESLNKPKQKKVSKPDTKKKKKEINNGTSN